MSFKYTVYDTFVFQAYAKNKDNLKKKPQTILKILLGNLGIDLKKRIKDKRLKLHLLFILCESGTKK